MITLVIQEYFILFPMLQNSRDNPDDYPEYYTEFFECAVAVFSVLGWSCLITAAKMDGGTVVRNSGEHPNGGMCVKCNLTRP